MMNSKLFKGNNLEVLEDLQAQYAGKIDLVYIDPPYNTNQTFSVNQNRISTISRSKSDEVVAYSDSYTRDSYLNYMKKVISLLYDLLSVEATLYLHIDCNFNHLLRVILDDVFGYDNFLNEIARVKCNPKNSERKAWGNNHDVILVYAKKKGSNIWNYQRQIREKDKSRFKKEDERGLYTTVPLHAPGETLNGDTGKPWKGMLPPQGRHWRIAPSKLDELDEAGMIEWSKTGNPRLKKYLEDYRGSLMQDTWLDFKDPQNPSYPTQKNIEMLDCIVKQSSKENSIVLDCFSGSGATLLAAAQNRRTFIGIDQSDVAIESARKNLINYSYEYFDYFTSLNNAKAVN